MKRAIFFEGSLQKWTITCSYLCALSLTCTLLILFIKKITYLLSTYRKRHLICREAKLLHFLIDFPAKNRTIFHNGLSGRHFPSLLFFKIFLSFFIWLLAARKKRKVPACVSKMCLFIKRFLFECMAAFQRFSLCDFLNNQWYMSIIPTASSSFFGLLRAPCSAQRQGDWARPAAGARGMCSENSFGVAHCLGRQWGSRFRVQGAFSLPHSRVLCCRTRTSAAIASWKRPPGTPTSRASTPWPPTCSMWGPGLQQAMETSAGPSSSPPTQVVTFPLGSAAAPPAEGTGVTGLCAGSFSLGSWAVVCLLWGNIPSWPHGS